MVSAPAQAIAVRDFDAQAALWAGVAANLIFIAVLPGFGILADRIGRRPVMMLSYGGLLVLTFPLNWLIQDQVWQLAVSMTVALLFLAASSAVLPTLYAEMFPTGVRTAGVGVPYALSVAACGGTAPYLQTWLNERGMGDVFLIYSMALLVLALVVLYRMPETKDIELT